MPLQVKVHFSVRFVLLKKFRKNSMKKSEIIRDLILNNESKLMSDLRVISAKIPEETYKEMILRVPEGNRSDFIREAIMEKLQKTPKPDKILELEHRLSKVESEFSEIKKYLADLELLTYERGKTNPHTFCVDETDHKVIDYLMHYKGATTPELAQYLKTNRWLILNRLRRIQKTSKKQLGKSIIDYCRGERSGKKKAWWINEELVEG
jgi:Arc/MetJ-type ribon-helix-helix transcriptional regulator